MSVFHLVLKYQKATLIVNSIFFRVFPVCCLEEPKRPLPHHYSGLGNPAGPTTGSAPVWLWSLNHHLRLTAPAVIVASWLLSLSVKGCVSKWAVIYFHGRFAVSITRSSIGPTGLGCVYLWSIYVRLYSAIVGRLMLCRTFLVALWSSSELNRKFSVW